jgi:hypothetical protein
MTGKADAVLTAEIAEQFLVDEQAVDLNSFATIDDAAAEVLATYVDHRLRAVLAEAATQLDAHASDGTYDASGMCDLSFCGEFADLQRALPLIDGFRHPRRGLANGFCCAYGFDAKTAAALSAGAARPIHTGVTYLFIDDAYASSLADDDFQRIRSQWIRVELHGEWDDSPMKGWLVEASKLVAGPGIPAHMPLSDEAVEAFEPLAAELMLELDGIASISSAAAASLAKVSCDLSLSGLEDISEPVAKILATHRYGSLMLGLTRASDAVTAALSEHKGPLVLNGIEVLTEGAAKALAQHKNELCLNAVTDLSDAAAEHLSQHDGDIQLNSLEKLSDAAAGSLSSHSGNLELDGLATLSDKAVSSLAKHNSLSTNSELQSQVNVMRRKSKASR